MNKLKQFCLLLFLLLTIAPVYSQENKAEKEVIKKHLKQAVVDFSDAKYDAALESSKQALVKSFAINDALLIAQSYNTIGNIYNECSETAKAIEFYNKALVYAKKLNNDKMLNWIYGNLGSVYYYNKNDLPKGIVYYQKSLYYAVKIKDTAQIEFTKLNLASAYFASKKYDLGNQEINDIREQVFSKDNEEAKMSLHNLLGIYNRNHNQKSKGEEHFFTAKSIAEKNGFDASLINVYENLVIHYKLYKDTENAQLYQEKFDSLSKVVYSQDKIDHLKKAATHIELQEYKVQLEEIEKENERQQKIVENSKLIVVLFIVILIIFLLLLITLYNSIKIKEQANLELAQANVALEKAEEVSQVKSLFVSTIAHELRTPLYSVISIANFITDEHKELTNDPHFKSLKFSAKYLLSLVNDILQINKIEEKKVVLKNHIFNLIDEITTVQNAVQYIAEKNNNKLTIEIDTAISEFLIGDKLRLSQIIMNLLSNALKFTHNGDVALIINLKEIEDKKCFIEFKVTDNGIGIAKEYQEKIFDKFVQIERKEEDFQGTGLGLSIVSCLVKLFESEIHFESEENVGTTFTFTIGFEYDEDKSRELINNIEVDLSESPAYNILVVEDNKINQMVTKKIIQNSSMSYTIVDDGYAAIVALERDEFDLILMDINMPRINGFETTRRIREKGIHIPIVALTAFDKQEVAEEAISSGMNDIMVRPFEPSRLFQVISNNVKTKSVG